MVYLSLTDLSFAAPERDGNFIGLWNYIQALTDDTEFLMSLLRSALFSVLCVLPQVLIGIISAELLYQHRIIKKIIAPVFILPVLLPAVVVGLYWKLLLQGEFGMISFYLAEWGLTFAKRILSDADSILLTLAIIDSWQWGPFVILMFITARGSLENTPLEAAFIDGASKIRGFFDVTLHRLIPMVLIVSFVRAIDSFKEFDKIFILTGGGPGTASELTSLFVWRQAFKSWEFGYAASLCVVIFLGIYIVTSLSTRRIKLGPRK